MFYFFKILINIKLNNFVIFIIKNFLIRKQNSTNKKKKTINILFLTIEKFRNDHEILSREGSINSLYISEVWLNIFFKIYYGKKKIERVMEKSYSVNPPNFYLKKRDRYQNFLDKLIKSLLNEYKLDFIVSADVRYYSNVDWGIVAEKNNIKWIVFHRENLYASKNIYDRVKKRHMNWEYFPGSKIFVHNKITKQMFMESKFIRDKKKIKVLGCMRMDDLHKKVKHYGSSIPKKIITLFSFQPKSLRFPKSVFYKTHQMVVLFAKNNPEIDVVIKPKIEITKKTDWNDVFYQSIKDLSLELKSIKNLSISPFADPHELIMKSLFTIGLNSSVVLESAITGIPVLIPYFKEMRTKEYKNKIYFRDYFDCFDTPRTAEEFMRVMNLRLKQRKISEKIQKRRLEIFEKYMGKFDSFITQRYISELNLLKLKVNEF